MPHPSSKQKIIRFNKYEADLSTGRLLKQGVKLKLREQSFTVLAELLKHPGEVVTRGQLRDKLWPTDTFVDFDNILNTAVGRLREALDDSAENPHFIETLPKRGYRFIGSISESAQDLEERLIRRVKIVVLPFANLSGDLSQEYLADGMTEEIIADLAALAPEQLAVIARATAMTYKGVHVDVVNIGSRLGVDYVVEGSVRSRDDRIVLNVQLIQVKDQTHILARRYDTDSSKLLATVQQATHAVAARIGVQLNGRSIRDKTDLDLSGSKSTENPEAYHLYLRGRYNFSKGTPEGCIEAKQCFENAIKQDPEFANAYCSLAEIYWHMGFLGLTYPREVFNLGIWCAVRALEIDVTLAEAHSLLGVFRKVPNFDWLEVHREMQCALELNPLSSSVRLRHGVSELMALGRMEEAIEEIKCALELDPLNPWIRMWYAECLDLGRQYNQGLQEIILLLEHVPTFWTGHIVAGHLYRDLHMYDQATAAQRKANELSSRSPIMLGWLGQALVNSGDIAEARAILKELPIMASQVYVPPTSFAWIHLSLGEIDSAFSWMDKAIDAFDPMITPIKNYPFLDPLRDDPRFHALLRKMNLES